MNRREFVKRSALTGLAVAVSPIFTRSARAQSGQPYIEGYPGSASVYPGDKLTLYVSTKEPNFRVTFCRQGSRLTPVATTAWQTGAFAEPKPADVDFGWPAYIFPIDPAWQPGVYIAMLETMSSSGVISTPDESDPYGTYGKALFVVRNPSSGRNRILYKLPLFTYHAYNYGQQFDGSGALVGGNLFADLKPYRIGRIYAGSRVTLQRPGGGTGGDYNDGGWAWTNLSDPYNGASRRNAYSHWDAPFVSWLETNGYGVDYCTDLDLHQEGTKLLDKSRYRLMLSAGNDEYWTREMRDNMRSYLQSGGNLAFFTGNTGEWQTHIGLDGISIYVNKDKSLLTGEDHWWDAQVEGSNQLVGADVRNGGQADGKHDPAGMTVSRASHWVYNGTGLLNGSVFGDASMLMSYKVEGARYRHNPVTGAVELDLNADDIDYDISPFNTRLLGYFEIGDEQRPLFGWSTFERENPGDYPPLGATMSVYTEVGTVFCAGTSDWARVLGAGDRSVDQITRNVLNTLGQPLRVAGLIDLNLDRYAEIIFRHPVTGHVIVWAVDEGLVPSGGDDWDVDDLVKSGWKLAGGGQFNIGTDANNDLLWQNVEDKTLLIWQMNEDLDHVGDARIDRSLLGPEWSVGAVADFNGDGSSDILWRNAKTGELLVWVMKESELAEQVAIDATGIPLELRLVGAGDLDGDGSPDLLWEDPKGTLTYSIISAFKRVADGTIDAPATPGFTAVGLGDLNADGQNEVLVQNYDTGEMTVRFIDKLRWTQDQAFNGVA